jgi:hypothetical protein
VPVGRSRRPGSEAKGRLQIESSRAKCAICLTKVFVVGDAIVVDCGIDAGGVEDQVIKEVENIDTPSARTSHICDAVYRRKGFPRAKKKGAQTRSLLQNQKAFQAAFFPTMPWGSITNFFAAPWSKS